MGMTDVEQRGEESGFLENTSTVTQKPLKTLIRLMILVYFSNNKPTCHNVTLVKLGKTQTVLFVFPFSYSSCLTIYFFTFQTLLFTYCNSITVIGLLQYSWRPASTCPFNIWNVVLPGKSCSLYCSWLAVFPFFPADIPAAPSVMHLTSLLIFNRKAGRNIHALIHVNVSPSPIILGYFSFFSQYCTIQADTLRTLQCQKKDSDQFLSE